MNVCMFTKRGNCPSHYTHLYNRIPNVGQKQNKNKHMIDTKPHLHIKLSDREHPSFLMILLTNFFF